ncbi:MAG: phosphoribosylformylglycinamidine synthase [Bacteroidales bacterium]|nr:phosphoribosylformylglycinamidine synthase [Bacteroidales bacterium]
MIYFFRVARNPIIAVEANSKLDEQTTGKLKWLFGNAIVLSETEVDGWFVGPRKEMITPWSTNAVEITQNMGIQGLRRIEEFVKVEDRGASYDPMLQVLYDGLDQKLFTIERSPEPVLEIHDIAAYNQQEGLALNPDEIEYLEGVSKRIGRKLTDSEVFGFSQVNSEHCRHKIFNGTFIIDGEEKESSLFQLIKKTTQTNPNHIVSAYKDNCSFAAGPAIEQFAPASQDKSDYFRVTDINSVLSLKAETHNFPTTVEPFNGAATGTGGEIRDRIAGGKAAIPLAGTAVYMTSYPRLENGRSLKGVMAERPWLYQTPEEILIKASNGASDFGNKFGQPLICGSLLTFEHEELGKKFGFDKVIMLAGGIGFGKSEDAQKDTPEKGDLVVLMGGDNYRIGMGGGAVSSVDTGEFENAIELNAVQRANPEMQKRVYNAIRALAESGKNTIVSIHDHGAGGHLNCLSELVEETGGKINLDKLPLGDPTLSAKELIGNESQERMGLVIKAGDVDKLLRIASRERAPVYIIGEITDDHRFVFESEQTGEKPMDLELVDMFGKPPRTIMDDRTPNIRYKRIPYKTSELARDLEGVLQMEAVACKDWLTNKVDRSVSGKVARQQCAGELQLPLNNLGVVALDYQGSKGYATSIGHAPVAAMVDEKAGSVLSIAEALTNIVWAPMPDRIRSISLSANWMWPCKNEGEDARLYHAARAASDFAIALGINIPTGKDSLSMTQKYGKQLVYAPGTVIISAAGEVSDIRKIVEPVLRPDPESRLIYVDLSKDDFKLGGSSFAQYKNRLGRATPTVTDPDYFVKVFNLLQDLIEEGRILAGHDVSAGGLITTLLELCYSSTTGGLEVDITGIPGETTQVLFSEKPAVVIQSGNPHRMTALFEKEGINHHLIGRPLEGRSLELRTKEENLNLDIDHYRDLWFRTSYLLDRKQSGKQLAEERYKNYKTNKLDFDLGDFKGSFLSLGIDPKRRSDSGVKAAIIREKGVNGDREMAHALYLAGFDVKDVHMTDLIAGRETLEELQMIVFVGGFSNSDVLGSARGWAGAFRYNEKARLALEKFYARKDTLSLGVCNGCQLMIELDLVVPDHDRSPRMEHNASGKFESSFLGVEVQENKSVMLDSLEGMKLGIWVAHGEGRFVLPKPENAYNIPLKYSRSNYPANPNGSDFDAAALCSADGRHLAMMPHLERAYQPWQCGYYPGDRRKDEATPWLEAFVNARIWIEERNSRNLSSTKE